MKSETGKKLLRIAKEYVGCHYLNGVYGATPDAPKPGDGAPMRRGAIDLIGDPSRLDPKQKTVNKALAVFAATSNIKFYGVCGGRHATFPGGRETAPDARDLVNYLDSLASKPVAAWKPFYEIFTPRRVYPGGAIVWGEDCRHVQHFDCVTYVNYCMWKLLGKPVQNDIKAWARDSKHPMKVVKTMPDKSKVETLDNRPNNQGGTVYQLSDEKPKSLEDGDILIILGGHEHIGLVSDDGVVYQAEDTHAGVTCRGKFNLSAPGRWTHLVRLHF